MTTASLTDSSLLLRGPRIMSRCCRKESRDMRENRNKTETWQRVWCADGPITESGKNRQMARMLTLILTPILVLVATSFYFVSDNITAKLQSDRVKNTVLFSVEVGKVIHAMQSERDMSVLYLSSIGPETKLFLTARYIETDKHLSNLEYWPAGLITYQLPQFYRKRDFQQYLTRHRNELDLLNHTLYDELNFYSENIRVFVRWLYDAIKESKYGTIWKTLVAYQKMVEAKEHVGIERAIGSAYFSTGGFVSRQVYEWYNRELHAFKANLKSATRYSSVVSTIANSRISSGGANLTKFVDYYRSIVQRRSNTVPSLKNATLYFDNMTLYIDLVFLTVTDLADEIVSVLEHKAASASLGVVRSSIIIFIVLVMCPILVKMMRTLTDDIQRYARILLDKTQQLKKERRRTALLLRQFLPKSVADQMKYKEDIQPDYYKDVSVAMIDIVGFSRLHEDYSPEQMVLVLHAVSDLVDDKVLTYNAVSLVTIGNSCVIASGLPDRNGDRHAFDIADISLDILDSVLHLQIDGIGDKAVKLRIGIHTGPCSAGVVDVDVPRYCLFGDVTKLATTLGGCGLPNRALMSVSTYRMLAPSQLYITQYRGDMEVKGNSKLVTYWLLGRKEDLGAPPQHQDRKHHSLQNHDYIIANYNSGSSKKQKQN